MCSYEIRNWSFHIFSERFMNILSYGFLSRHFTVKLHNRLKIKIILLIFLKLKECLFFYSFVVERLLLWNKPRIAIYLLKAIHNKVRFKIDWKLKTFIYYLFMHKSQKVHIEWGRLIRFLFTQNSFMEVVDFAFISGNFI